MHPRLHSGLTWFGLVADPLLAPEHDQEIWGVEILVVIDDLLELIARSPHVPFANTVHIDMQVAHEAAGRLRPAATDLFGMRPAHSGPIADVFSVIDELEDAVATASRIPRTERLRIDRPRLVDLLYRLRDVVLVALPESRRSMPVRSTRVTAILAAIDAIDDLAYQSKRARFSAVVILDETAVRDATAHLRSTLGEPTGPAGDHERPIADMLALVDELDELLRAAKRAPMTGRLRVPSEALYDLLDGLRLALGQVDRNP